MRADQMATRNIPIKEGTARLILLCREIDIRTTVGQRLSRRDSVPSTPAFGRGAGGAVKAIREARDDAQIVEGRIVGTLPNHKQP